MTKPAASRGRKRSRREEEDTPPRSLEELEQQDKEEQQRAQAGKALLQQPQGRASPPNAPGRAFLGSRGMPAGKSPMKQQGQSSMTDFLTDGKPNQLSNPALNEALAGNATLQHAEQEPSNLDVSETGENLVSEITHCTLWHAECNRRIAVACIYLFSSFATVDWQWCCNDNNDDTLCIPGSTLKCLLQ